MMNSIYKWGTLGLATIIGIGVSLACSFWFFYSLMGGTGPEAIGAGIAGCALQIFGYGFAASFLNMNGLARFILCAMPLALSMFSSYSATYGYLTYEQEVKLRDGRKTEVVYDIINQSSVDKGIASKAASQGVSEKYRTQAKGFLESNERALERDMAMLERLDAQGAAEQASPLDGLVKVTGDAALTTILFCAWLAVLFDLLPVVAITFLTGKEDKSDLSEQVFVDIESTELRSKGSIKEKDPEIQKSVKAGLEENETLLVDETSKSKVTHNRQKTEAKQIEQVELVQKVAPNKVAVDESYEHLLLKLRQRAFEPSYAAFMTNTGLTKWKAQKFFERCAEDGHVKRNGRSFEVVEPISNIALLDNARIAAHG